MCEERTDIATVREGGEGHTVVSVRDGFGVHSSAALTGEQVWQLIKDLGGVPNEDLQALKGDWVEGYESLDSKDWQNQDYANGMSAALEHCSKQLEELIEDE